MLTFSRACAPFLRMRGPVRALSSVSWHAFGSAETGLKVVMPLPVPLVRQAQENQSFLLEPLAVLQQIDAPDLSLSLAEQEVQSTMLCRGKKRWRKQGRKVMGIVSSKSRRRVANNGCLH